MSKRFWKTNLEEIAEIENWLSGGRDATVQFENQPPYPPEVLTALNRLCQRFGGKVHVSFQWSNTDGSFTGSELALLPDVVSLAIQSARPVQEIRRIWELPALRRLTLSIKKLNDSDLLQGDNMQNLQSLEIAHWGTRPLDLAPLARMTQLEMLRLARPVRNLSAISGLPRLKSLYLHLVQEDSPLGSLAAIPHLEELLIMSGARAELGDLSHPTLKELHIQDVRGLKRFVTTPFPALEKFSMHFQAQVTELACSSANTKLKRIDVLHCIRLERIDGLKALPSLEHLAIVECPVTADQVRNQ